MQVMPSFRATGAAISRYIVEQHQKGLVSSYTHKYVPGPVWTIRFGTYDTVIRPEVKRIASEGDMRVEAQVVGRSLALPQERVGVVLRLYPRR